MKRLLGVLVISASAPAFADPDVEPPPPPTPFDQGRFGLGFGGSSNDDTFLIAGGAGYYVLDGVELGLGLGFQFGEGPNVLRTTPAVRYVAQPLVGHSPVIPYAGVFYSHYFVGDGFADVDTVGTRGGLLYVSGSLVLGLGIVYEREVSECVEDCSQIYPDFTFSIAL